MLGSLVGGSATVAAARFTQWTHTKRELVQTDVYRRESLYGDFIAKSYRLLIDALYHNLEPPETLVTLYGLLIRIRLSPSDAALGEAERIARAVADHYCEPNPPVDELRTIAKSLDKSDAPKPFADACRVELKSLRSTV